MTIRRTVSVLVLISLIITFLAANNICELCIADAEEVKPLKFDFEDGKASDWKPMGGQILTPVSEKAHSGNRSLKISRLKQQWGGAELNLTEKLVKGEKYIFSVWVYNASDNSKEIRLSAYNRDNSSYDPFDSKFYTVIAKNTAVPAGEWIELKGEYTYDYSGNPVDVSFFIETPSIDFDFFIDDISITGNFVVQKGKSLCNTGFVDGKLGGWAAFGDSKLSINKTTLHTSPNSLKVAGRKTGWQGAKYDLMGKVERGDEISLSVWIYQNSGLQHNMNVTVCSDDGTANYKQIVYNTPVPSGKWTQLNGVYTINYSGELSRLFLYIEGEAKDPYFDYFIDDTVITSIKPERRIEKDIPSLYEVYKDYFPIGVAVPNNVLSDPLQTELIKKHFNSITPESEMKPGYLQSTENNFNFYHSDKYIRFCKENNIRLRGHTLVWHIGNPDWLFKDGHGNDATREVLLARMKTHISTVIKKYGDSIDNWDVVNEALNDMPPYGMRDTKWRRIIGDDYVEKAFEFAREAAREEGLKVKLYYNDYNSPENQQKTQAIYNLVRKLKDKGLIDGVGYQCHIDITSSPVSSIEESIKKFIELGLKVEITELDMSVYDNNKDIYTTIPKDLQLKQAYKYAELMEMLKKYKGSVTGVTFWGLKDDSSWLNNSAKKRLDAPLLFDKNCKTKLSYWGIADSSKLPLK